MSGARCPHGRMVGSYCYLCVALVTSENAHQAAIADEAERTLAEIAQADLAYTPPPMVVRCDRFVQGRQCQNVTPVGESHCALHRRPRVAS